MSYYDFQDRKFTQTDSSIANPYVIQTRDQVKLYCRVDIDDENSLIDDLWMGAIGELEEFLEININQIQRQFIVEGLNDCDVNYYMWTRWSKEYYTLPLYPHVTNPVLRVTEKGVERTLVLNKDYWLEMDDFEAPLKFIFAVGERTKYFEKIDFSCVAGFDANFTPPKQLVKALLLLAANRYEHRGEPAEKVVDLVGSLVWPYRHAV